MTDVHKEILNIARVLSEISRLDETEMSILMLLLADGKATNTELAKLLNFKDGNSIAYHIRTMLREGVINRYTIVPDWKKAGLGTEFVIIAEAENEEQLLEIEKAHVLMVSEYMEKLGDIVVMPAISGSVILQNVYHCFGDKAMAIMIGRATSDQDAAVYCKNYMTNRYPGIKISLLINKYKTINEFMIDERVVLKIKEFFEMGESDPGKILDKLYTLKDK